MLSSLSIYLDFSQEGRKRPVHWTLGGYGPGQLNLSGGTKNRRKIPMQLSLYKPCLVSCNFSKEKISKEKG